MLASSARNTGARGSSRRWRLCCLLRRSFTFRRICCCFLFLNFTFLSFLLFLLFCSFLFFFTHLLQLFLRENFWPERLFLNTVLWVGESAILGQVFLNFVGLHWVVSCKRFKHLKLSFLLRAQFNLNRLLNNFAFRRGSFNFLLDLILFLLNRL